MDDMELNTLSDFSPEFRKLADWLSIKFEGLATKENLIDLHESIDTLRNEFEEFATATKEELIDLHESIDTLRREFENQKTFIDTRFSYLEMQRLSEGAGYKTPGRVQSGNGLIEPRSAWRRLRTFER